MIKGIFLVVLLLAVASSKAAVHEKGEKKVQNNKPKKDLKTHNIIPFILLDYCEDESEDFDNINCPIQRGDYNGCCLCTQVWTIIGRDPIRDSWIK